MSNIIATGISSKLTAAEKAVIRGNIDVDKGVRDYQAYIESIFSKATLDLNFVKNEHKVYEAFGPTNKLITDAITTARNSTATYQGPVAIASAAINIPRIAYDSATGSPLGLLAEETRTNLLLRSEDFDNASWIKQSGATITPNTTIAPDGTSFADTLTTNNGVSVNQSSNTSSGIVHCQSVHVKAGTITRLMIRDDTGAGRHIVIDPVTGVVTSTSGTLVAHGVEKLPNGWLRPWFSYAADTNVVRMNIRSDAENAATVVLWGAQIEVGSFPTSYIPTNAAQVTRLGDVISRALTTTNANAGAIFVDFDLTSFLKAGSFTTTIVKLGDSANTLRRGFGLVVEQNNVSAFLRNSVFDFNAVIPLTDSLQPIKALVSFDLRTLKLLIAINGITNEATMGSVADISTFVSHIFIGGASVMTGNAIDHSKTVKRCAYFSRSFTTTEAQAITL